MHSPGQDRNHRFRFPVYVAGSFIAHNAPYSSNIVFVKPYDASARKPKKCGPTSLHGKSHMGLTNPIDMKKVCNNLLERPMLSQKRKHIHWGAFHPLVSHKKVARSLYMASHIWTPLIQSEKKVCSQPKECYPSRSMYLFINLSQILVS